MPLSKPSTDWARGIAKSLKRHLHIKVIKRRFSNKVHVYAPSSTGEGSAPQPPQLPSTPTKKAKPTKKSKSAKKSKPEKKLPEVNSIGVQACLPCRSLLEELSHEGNIDIMSYIGDHNFEGNTNANNSVDCRQVQQPVTSKPRVKSSSKWVIFCVLHDVVYIMYTL